MGQVMGGPLLPSQIESLIQSLNLLNFVCLLIENDNIILAIEESAFVGYYHMAGSVSLCTRTINT